MVIYGCDGTPSGKRPSQLKPDGNKPAQEAFNSHEVKMVLDSNDRFAHFIVSRLCAGRSAYTSNKAGGYKPAGGSIPRLRRLTPGATQAAPSLTQTSPTEIPFTEVPLPTSPEITPQPAPGDSSTAGLVALAKQRPGCPIERRSR